MPSSVRPRARLSLLALLLLSTTPSLGESDGIDQGIVKPTTEPSQQPIVPLPVESNQTSNPQIVNEPSKTVVSGALPHRSRPPNKGSFGNVTSGGAAKPNKTDAVNCPYRALDGTCFTIDPKRRKSYRLDQSKIYHHPPRVRRHIEVLHHSSHNHPTNHPHNSKAHDPKKKLFHGSETLHGSTTAGPRPGKSNNMPRYGHDYPPWLSAFDSFFSPGFGFQLPPGYSQMPDQKDTGYVPMPINPHANHQQPGQPIHHIPQPVQPVAGPSGSLGTPDIQRWLDSHNAYRARYSAPPLQWDPNLALLAHSETGTCHWKHMRNNPFGENIAAGQTSIQQVVNEWVNGPTEKESYSEQSPTYSHFTQVVWVATTHVGCAINVCNQVTGSGLPQSPVQFWACEYNPPGNIDGEYHLNVKAHTGGVPA